MKFARDLHCLIVEDDKIIQFMTARILTEMNCSVEVVGTGNDAIKKYKMNKYDFILMDLGLPDLDGRRVTKKIRTIEQNNNKHFHPTPIIAYTMESEEVKDSCLECGIDIYLTKPAPPQVLYETINHIFTIKSQAWR